MLWLPAARLAVLQVRLAAPAAGRQSDRTAAGKRPAVAVKPTLPVGALPVTVAVNVTLAPTVEGVREVARPVLLVALLTVCDSVALVEPALAVAAVGGDDAVAAHRQARGAAGTALLLALPVGSATAPQPVIVVPSP